jgi:hypothetical protein
MPFYRVKLEGENFPLSIDEEDVQTGFFTTRWVQALNKRRAELAAVDSIRKELRPSIRKPLEGEPPPMIYAYEIERVSQLPLRRPKGFTFFPMGAEP